MIKGWESKENTGKAAGKNGWKTLRWPKWHHHKSVVAPTIYLKVTDLAFSGLLLAAKLLFVLSNDPCSTVSCHLGPDEDCMALLHHRGAAGICLQRAGHHH